MNNTVSVDFARPSGPIKVMHAINNGPTAPHDDYGLYRRLTEAGIPYARLHDTAGRYGGAHYVDIPNVFPDFNADPDDPASYDFAFTDALLKTLTDAGVEPFYRLGVTIENYHFIKAYGIIPPADPLQWAKICAGIVRHYNEGWADGFHYGITYWEIWNEPDNEPEIADNPMWKGTPEQYFALYKVTSRYLKEHFPSIKVGGYASCGFYALSDANFSETAHSSSRVGYFIDFFHAFMRYITTPENRCPLDFFSWHSYADVESNRLYARYARENLDRYGFPDAELIFNEWNPGIALRGTLQDAANIAAMMCGMQDSPNDLCMYYDGQVSSSYCGLFDPLHHGVFKAYYAFAAWNELYKLENAVACSSSDGLYSAAAARDASGLVLVVNTTDQPRAIDLRSGGRLTGVRMLDASHDLTDLPCDGSAPVLPPYALCLLHLDL